MDLIRRQAEIEAICNCKEVDVNNLPVLLDKEEALEVIRKIVKTEPRMTEEEMNKQRKVLITITYNEMGVIIDTKAEEVAQPDLQPTCNQLATDYISRQAAIDAIKKLTRWYYDTYHETRPATDAVIDMLQDLPSIKYDSAVGLTGYSYCPYCGAAMLKGPKKNVSTD